MRRRPLSGALIGIFIGVAAAVILARLGVWPPDRLTVFLLPALIGLLGMVLLSVGRENSTPTMVVALVLIIPMIVWGALGLGQLDENGELNGGCTVDADSGVDTTTVTDTSRSNPFSIDTDSGLSWSAVSPEPFMDYEWQLHVIVGGIPIPIDSGAEVNSDGDTENSGDVPSVGEFAASRGIDLDLYRGVYQVGGSAATCDGFGFVEITADGADPVLIAAVVLVVLLVVLFLVLFFSGRAPSGQRVEDGPNVDVGDALGPYEAGSGGSGPGEDRP